MSTDARTRLLAHVGLLFYALIAVVPVALIVMNSFKTRRAIFGDPVGLPEPGSFDLVGYITVLERSNFPLFFANSLIVTVVSLALVLVAGSMAAHALAEYRFRGNALMGLYLAIGIMIPIRLGTVSILNLVVDLNLINTLAALILVYTAQGLPLAIFIMSAFMRQVPRSPKDAARVDGMNEYKIYLTIVLPMIRPVAATVLVFTMIPIWNDLWFPLILAPGEETKTVTLGAQQFIGQFITDWNAILAALTMAIVPVLVLYVVFSRQLIAGLTAGAVK